MVSDSFFALRAANSKSDHVPVFADFRFRKLSSENKYINAEEKNGKCNKYGYDNKQLKHDQDVDNLQKYNKSGLICFIIQNNLLFLWL